jgi:hypothetical protein
MECCWRSARVRDVQGHRVAWKCRWSAPLHRYGALRSIGATAIGCEFGWCPNCSAPTKSGLSWRNRQKQMRKGPIPGDPHMGACGCPEPYRHIQLPRHRQVLLYVRCTRPQGRVRTHVWLPSVPEGSAFALQHRRPTPDRWWQGASRPTRSLPVVMGAWLAARQSTIAGAYASCMN